MQPLLNWFASVSDTISTLIDYVVGFFNDLVNMVKMLGQAALVIPKLFSMIPAPVVVALAAGLAIAVLYKILGREG